MLPQDLSRTTTNAPIGDIAQSPYSHERATLFEKVRSAVCALYLVGNGMGQRGFSNLAGEVPLVGHPVAERRTETVDRVVAA